MAKKRVTIQMVAERAGVSRGTVDRVLNKRPHVKPEQQEKVLQAIKELGYVPVRNSRIQAEGLRDEEVSVTRIGFIIPTENTYSLREIKRGIRDAQILLADFQMEVVIEEVDSPLPSDVLQAVENLEKQRVAGIVLSGFNHISVEEKINDLHEKGIPVVVYGNDIPNAKRLCFYGQNLKRIGRTAGSLMSMYMKQDEVVLVGIGSKALPEQERRWEQF